MDCSRSSRCLQIDNQIQAASVLERQRGAAVGFFQRQIWMCYHQCNNIGNVILIRLWIVTEVAHLSTTTENRADIILMSLGIIYCEWTHHHSMHRCTLRFFDYMESQEDRKVKLVTLWLKGGASTWWNLTTMNRAKFQKWPVYFWDELKRLLRERFLPWCRPLQKLNKALAWDGPCHCFEPLLGSPNFYCGFPLSHNESINMM